MFVYTVLTTGSRLPTSCLFNCDLNENCFVINSILLLPTCKMSLPQIITSLIHADYDGTLWQASLAGIG